MRGGRVIGFLAETWFLGYGPPVCNAQTGNGVGPGKLAGKDSNGVALAHYLPEHRRPTRRGPLLCEGVAMARVFGPDSAIYRITDCPPDLCVLGQHGGYGGSC